MNEGRYNLRLNRGECCIPIQLQLASDVDFLTASGDGPASSHSGQVGFSDLSDSGSDIDIDAQKLRGPKSKLKVVLHLLV